MSDRGPKTVNLRSSICFPVHLRKADFRSAERKSALLVAHRPQHEGLLQRSGDGLLVVLGPLCEEAAVDQEVHKGSLAGGDAQGDETGASIGAHTMMTRPIFSATLVNPVHHGWSPVDPFLGA